MIDSVISNIGEFFRAVWEFVKKIFVKIVNFAKNIALWFRDPSRLKKLQEDKDRLAVSIKENLGNGNYNVINCLYDKEKEEIVGNHSAENEDALGMESEGLDTEAKKHFGNKDMIVLQ